MVEGNRHYMREARTWWQNRSRGDRREMIMAAIAGAIVLGIAAREVKRRYPELKERIKPIVNDLRERVGPQIIDAVTEFRDRVGPEIRTFVDETVRRRTSAPEPVENPA